MLKNIKRSPPYNQRGVVLVVTLVFLIALTSIASMLMQNTTMDVKMSGASQEKLVATQEAISAADEAIYNEVQKIDGINEFTQYLEVFEAAADQSIVVPVSYDNTAVNIQKQGDQAIEVGCGAVEKDQVSNNPCNFFKVRVTRTYGRTNNSSIQISAGIVQQVQSVSN